MPRSIPEHRAIIVNPTTKRLHDRLGLRERCNTDQIPKKRYVSRAEADALIRQESYRWCQICS